MALKGEPFRMKVVPRHALSARALIAVLQELGATNLPTPDAPGIRGE
jgi:hypothetical protein